MDTGHLLQQELLQKIGTGEFQPGHRIPTERELSEQYRLSRSTVRRVLSRLKEKGLITQTVGSGTYVREAPAGVAPQVSPPPTSPAELMEARLALEPAIVVMVIRNATALEFQSMDEYCARAEAASSLEEFEIWDGKLHEVIAEAAHNTFILRVARLMSEARNQGVWGRLKQRSLTPERRSSYQREHRALVAALKDRDLERAQQLTLEHLVHVRRNLLGY